MINISLGICILCLIQACRGQELDINVNITQLFVYTIAPEMLSWSEKGKNQNSFCLIPSITKNQIIREYKT